MKNYLNNIENEIKKLIENGEKYLTIKDTDLMYKLLSIKNNLKKDPIQEEFEGAEEYLKEYHETHDVTYLTMITDELNHGMYLLNVFGSTAHTEEEKKYYQDMKLWHDLILDKLNKEKDLAI